MREMIRKNDYFVLLSCVVLGIIAEIIFFQIDVGIGFLLFVSCFYIVFFLRFRLSAFHHRRIGLFLMGIIWLLSATFLLFGKNYFYVVNMVLIPILMLIHIIVITRPNTFIWGTTKFARTMWLKLIEAVQYNIRLVHRFILYLQEKKLFVISCLFLFTIIGITVYSGYIFILVRIVFMSMFIFGVFQVLRYQKNDEQQYRMVRKRVKYLHGNRVLIISVFLNLLLLILFFTIQFSIVQMFIWTICVNVLTFIFFYFVLEKVRSENIWHRVSYTILLMINGLYIYRMMQFILDDVEHHFWTVQKLIGYIALFYILFLCIYTLIRIWANRISLTHFYFIIGLLFYTIVNIIHVEQFVAVSYEKKDMQHEQYLEQLSYSGWVQLMELYESEDQPMIDTFLHTKVREERKDAANLLSYNFSREGFIEMYTFWQGDQGKEEDEK